MSILSLLDGLSVEEVGKLVLGERNQLIQNKMQELLDSLLESEICEFFEDATNATTSVLISIIRFILHIIFRFLLKM